MEHPRPSYSTATRLIFSTVFGCAAATLSAAQGTKQAQAPQNTQAPPSPANGDPGWPRTYRIEGGGTAVVYQPQVQSWKDEKHLVAWSAVSYSAPGEKKPALGTIRLEADTKVSTESRLVELDDLEFKEFHFPTLSPDASEELASGLRDAIPDSTRVIALDRILANLDKSSISVKNTDGVKSDPPKIFHSQSKAIMVNFDGPPIWSGIDKVELKYAVNTNWDVFQTPDSSVYLRNNDGWLHAPTIEGPWKPAGTLPEVFSKLPNDSNWSDVRKNLPGKPITTPPAVFVATVPAELILIDGPARFEKVEDTDLLWLSNTQSDVFRMGSKGAYYYLVAGRWFSAASLDGPWTFVTPNLPDDFKRIPVDHPRSRVLASVPGTDQAIAAVLLAQIPNVARVNKKELSAPPVTYQGDPTFEVIAGTEVSRAVNTDKDVIKVGDYYYLCYQAVWFVSKSPTGPFEVASKVPESIYSIPPSSPAHSVTYVTIQESDPNDEWETVAYTAAYTGVMVAWGCAMWGSGYYYPPYYYPGYRPIYYPYPVTYGFSAWYNPYTGAYGRGAAVYGPYGGAGYAASYNPRTGTYARGAAAYGPYNSRAAGQAYNPRTGTYAATRQGSNMYGNWGSSYVQRGDNWAQTAHRTNYQTGQTTSGIRTSEGGGAIHSSGPGGSGTIAKTGSGDIYAGHDGNVYRKQDGEWQKWENGGWSSGAQPKQGNLSGETRNTPNNLDPDRTARQNSNASASAQSNYNRSGGTRQSAGSYRPSGGRGSGGRRR
ncbi:MAG TPA: hypothetical protein VEI06_17805 [Gemmatimonadaceae bacterium]|nr:hypothetical protein [Gemmatimonadaceae bacterium]